MKKLAQALGVELEDIQKLRPVEVDYSSLGKNIRELREVTGISQEQLAKLLKITKEQMSDIESGQAAVFKALPDIVQQIAECFGVNASELIPVMPTPNISE